MMKFNEKIIFNEILNDDKFSSYYTFFKKYLPKDLKVFDFFHKKTIKTLLSNECNTITSNDKLNKSIILLSKRLRAIFKIKEVDICKNCSKKSHCKYFEKIYDYRFIEKTSRKTLSTDFILKMKKSEKDKLSKENYAFLYSPANIFSDLTKYLSLLMFIENKVYDVNNSNNLLEYLETDNKKEDEIMYSKLNFLVTPSEEYFNLAFKISFLMNSLLVDLILNNGQNYKKNSNEQIINLNLNKKYNNNNKAHVTILNSQIDRQKMTKDKGLIPETNTTTTYYNTKAVKRINHFKGKIDTKLFTQKINMKNQELNTIAREKNLIKAKELESSTLIQLPKEIDNTLKYIKLVSSDKENEEFINKMNSIIENKKVVLRLKK